MDGSSSTGSNANSSAGPFTSEESTSQSHRRQKADIAWAHVSEGVNAQGRKTMTCIYYHKTFAGGGIFRMKQHLAGTRGSIVSCGKVPPKVRHVISVTLTDIFEKKKEKKGEFGVENPFGRSVDEFDGDEAQEIPIIHTKGITINEASAPSDKGKRKTITLGPVRIMGPLIRLLCVCDTDERPSLGYVYEGMYRAINGIKKLFKNKERFYKPYTDIINERWDRMLRKNLHAATYYLNLAFQYDPTFSTHPEITNGLFDYIESKVDWCSLDVLTYEIEFWVVEETPIGELDYDELEEELEELPIPLESSNFQQFEDDGDEAEPEDVNLDLFQRRNVLVDEDDWI
ncbi:hypothetical protein ZIOFF_048133 [Zingiber officinale]|uniref:BED-type domain-containing protein n=1 Tax=Zingiber officinale TaxID=94328 RepID=A0A8J5KLZ4_ZINOF|nr:hypothetical protein ZIOFF_048133 [Zingiber officinale]